jgi:hypothetical protein
MPRYVILRHELPPGHARASHYDLMFDVGDVLRTWAVAEAPDSPVEQAAEALPDHRREYLTYEGPVSGNRGEVTRWDEGTFETLPGDAEALVADVRGRRLRGTIHLSHDGRYAYASAEPRT